MDSVYFQLLLAVFLVALFWCWPILVSWLVVISNRKRLDKPLRRFFILSGISYSIYFAIALAFTLVQIYISERAMRKCIYSSIDTNLFCAYAQHYEGYWGLYMFIAAVVSVMCFVKKYVSNIS